MPSHHANKLIASTVMLSMVATPVFAKSADDLQDLVGARGAGGETQLEARGFEHIKTEEGDSSKYSYWWNADKKDCVRVETYDGRYSSISDASNSDCGKKSGGSGAAIAAAAIGAAAIGAILLSRKNKDKDQNDGYEQDWQQVEVHGLRSSRLNIYDGPTKSARLRGQANNGELLRNYGCDNYSGTSWCEVATMDGRTRGWSKDKYLRVTNAGAGHYPSHGGSGVLVEVYGLSEPLKLRSGLSKSDDVIGRVRVGTTLRRLGCRYSEGENWCHVTTLDGRMNGWAREKFMRSASGASHYPSYGGSHNGSISGIKGMSGVEAFDELRSRGFANVDSFSSGRTLYGIYYYRPTSLCVQTTSANGSILDIRDIRTHPKCR